jgi:hypothetical protein
MPGSVQESPKKPFMKTFWGNWVTPILIAMVLAFTIERLIVSLLGWRMNTILVVLLYIVCYTIVSVLIAKLGPASDKKVLHPAMKWPMSGPIHHLGHIGMALVFMPTALLSSFNPWQFVQQIKQIFGQIKISKRLKGNEEFFETYQTKVEYQYPFNGQWLIYNGGYSEDTSHSWGVLTQRYAFDFVMADKDYRRHEGKGNRLRQYHCYDQPIIAAADGEVISVVDKINPAPLVGYGVADFLCRHFAGNHVIIKHAEGEYGFYAHLVKGTIPVKPGEQVKQGQVIGHCGHTGMSSEPHLHFHLQDKDDLFTAMGLPIKFNGQAIERGEFVSNPNK